MMRVVDIMGMGLDCWPSGSLDGRIRFRGEDVESEGL